MSTETAAPALAAEAATDPTAPGVRVRDIVLDADGVPLSGLLATPPPGVPLRATVVAVHGGGMRAGYFDARTHPGQSLLTLAAGLGFAVVAVDRPGYGLSAGRFPSGATLAEQSGLLHAALARYARHHDTGAGVFLLAHSYGGKLALHALADDRGAAFLGADISGTGHHYVPGIEQMTVLHSRRTWRLHWGRLDLYPPGAFLAVKSLVTPMPVREVAEVRSWGDAFPALAARVRVPVRFTFAEHEGWWRHDEETIASMRTAFTAAPQVVFDRQSGAGHNISLGWAARSYHLRALAFFEGCLAARAA
ncbi:alpha/beta hydrolase [Streptomyces sp. NPDC008001]|uniref:alpha/beta hydrolase n=1 Tax=Streptomyces sp. NPDC008001 TaxID=3364804 RepID=UPI0036E15887